MRTAKRPHKGLACLSLKDSVDASPVSQSEELSCLALIPPGSLVSAPCLTPDVVRSLACPLQSLEASSTSPPLGGSIRFDGASRQRTRLHSPSGGWRSKSVPAIALVSEHMSTELEQSQSANTLLRRRPQKPLYGARPPMIGERDLTEEKLAAWEYHRPATTTATTTAALQNDFTPARDLATSLEPKPLVVEGICRAKPATQQAQPDQAQAQQGRLTMVWTATEVELGDARWKAPWTRKSGVRTSILNGSAGPKNFNTRKSTILVGMSKRGSAAR